MTLREAAHALRPEVTWVRWRFDGYASRDGLVFVNGHWRWFPKPYRIPRRVLTTLWG